LTPWSWPQDFGLDYITADLYNSYLNAPRHSVYSLIAHHTHTSYIIIIENCGR